MTTRPGSLIHLLPSERPSARDAEEAELLRAALEPDEQPPEPAGDGRPVPPGRPDRS